MRACAIYIHSTGTVRWGGQDGRIMAEFLPRGSLPVPVPHSVIRHETPTLLRDARVRCRLCRRGSARRSAAAELTARAAESSARAGTFFPTEQLSIVKDITAAIANMGAVAGHGPNAPMPGVRQVPRSDSVLARFEVTPIGGPSIVVNITDHIWAPAAYVTFAAAAAGTASSCSELPPRILDALLHPSRDVIQQENARVSARLRTSAAPTPTPRPRCSSVRWRYVRPRRRSTIRVD